MNNSNELKNKNLFFKFSFILILFFLFIYFVLYKKNKNNDLTSQSNKSILNVLTYSSFASEWGPGPLVKDEFEKICNCTIKYNVMPDSRSILTKFNLISKNDHPDVVIGLDIFDTIHSDQIIKVKSLNLKNHFEMNGNPSFLKLINKSKDNKFILSLKEFDSWIPYDWGILTLVTKKDSTEFNKNLTLDDLTLPALQKKLILQDPRTSSPGLVFLVWLFNTLGETNAINFYKNFKPYIYGSSWSDSYGLFTQGQAKGVFSYTTSPHFHSIEEKDNSYRAIQFNVDLPVQIEHMALLDTCKNCDLGEQFIKFLLSPEIQKIIMTKNYMYPVINNVSSNTLFADHDLYNAKIPDNLSKDEITKWVDLWLNQIRK